MAFKHNPIPSWLSNVKEDTIKTNEWNELSKHIYEAVDQHLSQSYISHFTDLTEEEKNLLLERAARSLPNYESGTAFENLQSKLSYLLDQTVNNQVAKKMFDGNSLDTKTDLVLDTTSEGIITLLRKQPEQKYKLKVFLNQSIPQPIRFLTWQLYFSNQIHRKNFINKLETNPKLCLSPQDAEIQRRCESVLNSSITFSELSVLKGFTNSIKGILSYFHSTINVNRSLEECEYLFAIPIAYSHFPPFSKTESPNERSMAILIEIYFQFISTLPKAILESINQKNDEMNYLIKNVINILEEFDKPLLNYIRDLSQINTTLGIEDIAFHTCIKSICSPLIRCLFSGYLNLNTLMFVWDQFTLGVDTPGYNEELVCVINSIILMLLRDQLISVKNLEELKELLKNQTYFIQTRQIQALINKYFFKNLQTKLNSSNRIGPIIDPTAGRLKPWEHWHQEIIPRRKIRNKEPNELDEDLKAEISKRIQYEKAARDEIERLRKELDDIRRKPEISKKVSIDEQKEFELNGNQTKNSNKYPVSDILERIKRSVNKIAHSEGSNKKTLDNQTSEDLKLHKLDLKIAEKEVFGHHLAKNEWERLSNEEKKRKSEQMLLIVKKRLEKRFNETGRF